MAERGSVALAIDRSYDHDRYVKQAAERPAGFHQWYPGIYGFISDPAGGPPAASRRAPVARAIAVVAQGCGEPAGGPVRA